MSGAVVEEMITFGQTMKNSSGKRYVKKKNPGQLLMIQDLKNVHS